MAKEGVCSWQCCVGGTAKGEKREEDSKEVAAEEEKSGIQIASMRPNLACTVLSPFRK